MTAFAEKAEKQVVTLQGKITKLSGYHLTNTPLRQREQRYRDEMMERHRLHIQALQYLGAESAKRELTVFEQSLLVGVFYEDMRSLLARKKYNQQYGLNDTVHIFDVAMDKRMRKAGICDGAALNMAVLDYEAFMDKVTIPEDPNTVRIRDLTYKAEMLQGVDIHFTPANIVFEMLKSADLDADSYVLEPEAGTGRIADELRKITPRVECAEIVWEFRELLELKGHDLIGRDFLTMELPKKLYDRVVMNPPFSNEYEHIQHAYDFLKPGGILVSIASDHVMHPPAARIHQEFQKWLIGLDHSVRNTDARFQMTSVPSVLLVIHKGEEA